MLMRTVLRSVMPASSRRAMLAGICVSALVVSLLVTGPARAAVPCVVPPQTFPVAQIVPGMTGIGHTVIRGTTIEQFDVEILGVLPDYIFLGIDIIVAEMTGPAALVEETGGAVAGMSGSPVYINGRLAGALAWAVAEDRHIFGISWKARAERRTARGFERACLGVPKASYGSSEGRSRGRWRR